MTRSKSFDLLVVTIVFCISRILYYGAGVRFEGATYLKYWQFIDPTLLVNDLWRSVAYLHSQPPLLNLFTGVILQIFPQNHTAVFHVIFLFCGLVLSITIYFLAIRLGLQRWLAVALSVWFVVSPPTILYENWLFYTYPLTAIFCLSALFLVRFVESKRGMDCLIYSFLLAGMALTWSLFHLLWMLFWVVLLFFLLEEKRRVAIWSLPALLLVIGWYAKNSVLYDSFTASSWSGMNLANIVTFRIDELEREAGVSSGLLSEFALLPPFSSPEEYLKFFPETSTTGIQLLDQYGKSTGFPNYHHLVYIAASERYMKEAVQLLIHFPKHYLSGLTRSTYIYFHSASNYLHVLDNWEKIAPLEQVWNNLFYGQTRKESYKKMMSEPMTADHVAWWIVLDFLLAVIGGSVFLWHKRKRMASPEVVLPIFMLLNILYVTTVSIAMDIGENNRFRFVVDPFILLLSVFIVQKAVLYIQGKYFRAMMLSH